jgi:hypothetical protein
MIESIAEHLCMMTIVFLLKCSLLGEVSKRQGYATLKELIDRILYFLLLAFAFLFCLMPSLTQSVHSSLLLIPTP